MTLNRIFNSVVDLVRSFDGPEDKSADDGVADEEDRESDGGEEESDEALEAADTAARATRRSLVAVARTRLRLLRQRRADHRLTPSPPASPPGGRRRRRVQLQRRRSVVAGPSSLRVVRAATVVGRTETVDRQTDVRTGRVGRPGVVGRLRHHQ